eukprot:scaffold104403_cov31-Tisochrysis_lutea.AAC.3
MGYVCNERRVGETYARALYPQADILEAHNSSTRALPLLLGLPARPLIHHPSHGQQCERHAYAASDAVGDPHPNRDLTSYLTPLVEVPLQFEPGLVKFCLIEQV